MRLNRAAATLAAVLLLAGCTGGSASTTAPASGASADLSSCPTSQPAAMPAGTSKLVTIVTAKGTIVIKVEGALSPIAAGNFVALAQCGYYTNVVFHRLMPGFVIQAGDGKYGRKPNLDMTNVGTGGPGYTIKDETVTGSYTRGTVAMAKTSRPNSADSQFFIVLADNQLDPSYQIFGHVTSGMDAVDAIAAMPNAGGQNGTALQPVAMDKVTVSNP
jgi:cyclophilin family peptidyl-prolyl cis-trans isomerase